MEEAIKVRDDVVIPGSEIWFTASRSGGPGGQHVNTTSSRVSLHWRVQETAALTPLQKSRLRCRLASRISAQGVLTVSADSERSQYANRQIARRRLADLVREAIAKPRPRVPTRAPNRVVRQRLNEKARRGAVKRLRRPPEGDG